MRWGGGGGLDTPDIFHHYVAVEDSFCDCMIVFLHADPLLKRGLSLGTNSFLFSRSFLEGRQNHFDRVSSPENILIPLKHMDNEQTHIALHTNIFSHCTVNLQSVWLRC